MFDHLQLLCFRYLNRTARHAKLREDPDFKQFLEAEMVRSHIFVWLFPYKIVLIDRGKWRAHFERSNVYLENRGSFGKISPNVSYDRGGRNKQAK